MVFSSLLLATSLALSPVNEVDSNFSFNSTKITQNQDVATISTNISNCVENKINPFFVFINNANNLSAISLEVHFDPSIIDFAGIFTYDNNLLDYNLNSDEGVITLSSIFNAPINGNYQFLQLNILPKEVSQSTFTTIDFLVTNAFDSSFNQVNVQSCSESFYVNNNNEIDEEDLEFFLNASKDVLIRDEEFSLSVYCDELYKINAGNFTLSYDKDLLEFVSYQKGSFLENTQTLFDIKYDNPGSIEFSFINTAKIQENELITFTFKSKENIDSSCYLTFTPTNLIDNDLNKFSSSASDLKISFSYSSLVEQKDALSLKYDLNEETKELFINIFINDGIDFAVGDFNITFDTRYFTYIDYSKTSILNNFYISSVDDAKKDNGQLDFHLLTLESNYNKGLIFTFKFNLFEKCNNFDTFIEFTGKNLATLDLQKLKNINTTSSIKTSTLSHIYSDWTITNEPTCTENGIETRVCSVCGAEETREIPATGHDTGSWIVVKEPTCTEDGLKELHCDTCNALLDKEVIPATGHDEGTWVTVKEPTCTEDGLKELQCNKCGEVLDSETIKTTGHNFSEWTTIKDPTCTEAGLETRTCSICGETESREIPAKGHDEGTWVTVKEPACTEDGLKELHCNTCDEVLDSEVIEATGHDAEWVVTKEATETESGVESYICKNCGEVLDTREIPVKENNNSKNNLALQIALTICGIGVIIAIIIAVIAIKANKRKKHF